MTNPLAQIAADLRNAGGAGGHRLIAAEVAAGRVMAEVGAAVRTPGPGLTQIAGKRATVSQAAETSADLGAVASHMSVALADGGADLALGLRR
jgi:hypothetical protein